MTGYIKKVLIRLPKIAFLLPSSMERGCFGTKCLSIASITHHGEIAKFYIICKREKNTLFGAFIDLSLDPVTFDTISFLVITRLKILSVLPTI